MGMVYRMYIDDVEVRAKLDASLVEKIKEKFNEKVRICEILNEYYILPRDPNSEECNDAAEKIDIAIRRAAGRKLSKSKRRKVHVVTLTANDVDF